MDSTVSTLLSRGGLRERCSESIGKFKCLNCGETASTAMDWENNADRCPICLGSERKFACDRCEELFDEPGLGGEHPCRSVTKFERTRAVTFEPEMLATEAERLVAEEAHRSEAERLAAEELRRRNAERREVEESRRRRSERLAAEEARHREAERLAAEEARHREAERLAAEEAHRREVERLAVDADDHLNDFDAKRKAALGLLKETGMLESHYSPPIMRLLWRKGVQVRPLHFYSFGATAVVVAAFVTVFWAIFYGLGMHFLGGISVPIIVLFVSGALFGAPVALLFSSIFEYGRRKHRLPKWSSLGRSGEAYQSEGREH